MTTKTQDAQTDQQATATGALPLTGVKGGAPEKPLNIIAHTTLNRFWDRAVEFVLSKLGHGQSGPGDETQKAGDVNDMRTVTAHVFAAPPTRNARGGKGAATVEVISPSRDEAVTKRGRRTFKAVGKKDKTRITTTEDGSWRVHITTQKFASGADRDAGELKARDSRAILKDCIIAALHIRQNMTGRSGSWRKAASDIGFLQTPTGKYDKQGKPRSSWAKVDMTPALKEAINDMSAALPAIPENLFMDLSLIHISE